MAINETGQKLSTAIHEQYGAAIEMLESVITKCPEGIWYDSQQGPPFWQVVYHTMFYLDLYLSSSKEERDSFKAEYESEFRILDSKPDTSLNREQVLIYLKKIKLKAKRRLVAITTEELNQPSVFEWHGSSILSSFFYNLRHVMLHVGALNSRLLRKGVKLDNWISQKLIEEE
ncbi:MAG: DinB family protein [Candidatus Thorarchaeota archaeon]